MTHAGTDRLIRVLVADDDPGVLGALCDLLGAVPGMAVVARARDAGEAVELAARSLPDVAVLDVRMPGGGGPRATRDILGFSPGTRVVALSAHEDRGSVAEMIRAGALSYIVKGGPIDDIVATVERASRGLASLSSTAVSIVATELEEQLARVDETDQHRRQILADVDRALAPGALRADYQPIVELATGRVMGYEALARFEIEPRRSPDRWFAAAEEAGLREELELAAVRAAYSDFEALPPSAYLSLNLSPGTLVADRLRRAVATLADPRIVVEVTEHAAVDDYAALERALGPIRSAGGRLAVDDAGAGFASLRHILRLRPDIIKLDVELTRGIEADRGFRSLAAALVAFGAEMSITLVAEGIETRSQRDALLSLGVHGGQGWHFGPPGPLPQATSG